MLCLYYAKLHPTAMVTGSVQCYITSQDTTEYCLRLGLKTTNTKQNTVKLSEVGPIDYTPSTD